jgi:hypothetical protein
VQFSKLTACVTCIDNSYDVEVCTDSSKLIYGESKTYKYTCKFVPSPNDIGKEITVSINIRHYLFNWIVINLFKLLTVQYNRFR